MSVYGTSINESPVITIAAGAAIAAPAYLAVMGDGTVAGAGKHALGLVTASNDEAVASGDTLHVQIKDVGAWKCGTISSGSEIAIGDELASDANGCATKAGEGDFVLAVALQAATATGQRIQVQICKAGYIPEESGEG